MALHAGFAVALSTTKDAAQTFIHAAYVNGLIPATINIDQIVQGTTHITGELVLAEPLLQISADVEDSVTAHVEVLGPLTFSAPDKPTMTFVMHYAADVTMLVTMITEENTGAIQFGLDTASVHISITRSERISGPDPSLVYGIDPANSFLAFFTLNDVITNHPEWFLLTAPQFPQFLQLGYKVTFQIKNTEDSLNIGLDVVGMTQGDRSKLVDLNRISTTKGFKKTFHQSLHTSDDEYGSPIYDTQWGPTVRRNAGPHNTAFAVSMNQIILADTYNRLGRQAVLAAFEKSKHEAIIGRLQEMRGKDAVTTYEPTKDSLTFINEMEISLQNDGHIQVTAVASNFGTVPIHVDVKLKLAIIFALVDGDSAFVHQFSSMEGITAEVFDVDISQPEWITAILAAIGIIGVMLAPFTTGISAVLALFIDVVLASIVSSELSNTENKVYGSLDSTLADPLGAFTFTLPETVKPTMELKPDDFVVSADAFTGFVRLHVQTKNASIYIKGQQGLTTWPATTLDPIVVVFEEGDFLYNPFDPSIRIRWQIHGNQMGNLLFDIDTQIKGAEAAKQISIDHAASDYVGYSQFVVSCRVYRPWNEETKDLFNQKLLIKIEDRLDRTHPYVHWNHTVYYKGFSAKLGQPDRKPLGWQIVDRNSHIHYTNPAKRCRFSSNFPNGILPIYFDTLPFPIELANEHRKEICPYCFFGGPDKHVLK